VVFGITSVHDAVLCIGDIWFAMYTDEWLLSQEQALYEREGLKVKKIHYTDNQDCIGLTFAISTAVTYYFHFQFSFPFPD